MNCRNFLTKFLNRPRLNQEPQLTIPTTTSSQMPPTDLSETVRTLQRLLQEKNDLLRLREDAISMLERQLEDRDALIRHLKNEIDKFRQVVRPITQKIITKQINLGDDAAWTVVTTEKAKAVPAGEHRTKRQAISAEPINSQLEEELQITKIPKGVK